MQVHRLLGRDCIVDGTAKPPGLVLDNVLELNDNLPREEGIKTCATYTVQIIGWSGERGVFVAKGAIKISIFAVRASNVVNLVVMFRIAEMHLVGRDANDGA